MIKRCGRTLLAAVLALMLLGTAAFASNYGTPDGPFSAELLGDYLPALSTFMVTGSVMTDSHKTMLARFGDFSEAYSCHVYVWQWATLENSGYASFEDAVAAMEPHAADNTVCVVYLHSPRKAYVRVGAALTPEADADALADKLLHGDAEPFPRFAAFYDALCETVGRAKGTYVTGNLLSTTQLDRQGLEQIMVPLHEAFPGYIWVDYSSDGGAAGTEYSVLRHSREIDYNATYALWEHPLEYYFEDALYLTYYSQTGTAFLDFGKNTGVKLSDKQLRELEAAFAPSADGSGADGFRAGTDRLAAALAKMDLRSGQSGPSGWLIAALAVAGAAVLVVLLLLLRRKKGKKPRPDAN